MLSSDGAQKKAKQALGWIPATLELPCPICGKTDWCSVSADGSVAICRRVAEGGVRRQDRVGAEYWVHRLAAPAGATGAASPQSPQNGAAPSKPGHPSPPVEAAAPEVLDRVYRAALGALTLSEAHFEALRRRGLPDAEVRHRGYRTLADLAGALAAGAAAQKAGGAAIGRVPGFRRRPVQVTGSAGGALAGAGGAVAASVAAPSAAKLAWVLSAHPGLLIPVRDVRGRIIAIKVRRDDAGDGGRAVNPRYVYASSTRWGGPGPGAPSHLPIITAPLPERIITDAPLAHSCRVSCRVSALGHQRKPPWRVAWRPRHHLSSLVLFAAPIGGWKCGHGDRGPEEARPGRGVPQDIRGGISAVRWGHGAAEAEERRG